ncbi:MAG: TolC family protein [Pseudomonadota bacterium]
MQNQLRFFAVATFAVTLAGCSVVPNPFSHSELSEYARDKHERVDTDQEPVSGSIDLYEAMARALKYNLDRHVEVMEELLRDKQLRVAHHGMLPNVLANTAYFGRDKYSGGTSARIISARQINRQGNANAGVLPANTSQELERQTADLAFSWNILDFGLSYVRAKQASDQVLIARETRRKVVNRIIENVRAAYWKAVTARRLIRRLNHLSGRVRHALANARALSDKAESSPLAALTYERELSEIDRELKRLHADLAVAKTQLGTLMNIRPGEHFHIVVPHHQIPPEIIRMPVGVMVSIALESRSELREVAYRSRINRHEAEAAILEMLPNVTADLTPSFDSNDFLFNNNWVAWGAKASWNLMKVFSYPARRSEIKARDALLDKRALAVTMAIMTQVHVARVRLIHARRKHRAAIRYRSVQQRILYNVRRSHAAGKVSEQTAIREEMNTLVARVKLDLAYVDLQTAYANLYASMGLDPFHDMMASSAQDVKSLSKTLRIGWRKLGDPMALPGTKTPKSKWTRRRHSLGGPRPVIQ